MYLRVYFAGIINSILSLRIFEIFSRLSYGMYLVHYAIIHLTYLSTRSSIELGIMDQVIDELHSRRKISFGFIFRICASGVSLQRPPLSLYYSHYCSNLLLSYLRK